MKKLLVLLLIFLVSSISFGISYKGIPKKVRVNRFHHLPTRVGTFAPHGYVPRGFVHTLTRKSFKPVVTSRTSRLLKAVYPHTDYELPTGLSTDAFFIAQLENHACILESQLPYLYSMDTDAIFFADVSEEAGITTVRTKRDFDVFDPTSQRFYTLKKSTTLDIPSSQISAIGKELRRTDLYTVRSQNDNLQEIALSSSGERSFLLEKELLPLALLRDSDAMSDPFITASEQKLGYEISVMLQKPLVVFMEKEQKFTTFSEGSYLSLGSQGNTISHKSSSIPDGLNQETLLTLLKNDTQHVFFEEPFESRVLKNGETRLIYRSNFGVVVENPSMTWQPDFIRVGDYLMVGTDNTFEIIPAENINTYIN